MKIKIIIFFLFISFNLFAQNNLSIKINFKSLKDTNLYLGYYYGNKTYVIDTAKINKQGTAEFISQKKMPAGIYFIALPDFKYFDIILDKNQNFTINVDNINQLNKINFINSTENTNFYNYKNKLSEFYKISSNLVASLQANKTKNDSVYKIQRRINAFNAKIKKYKLQEAEKNKGTFLYAIIKSMIEPDINEFNKLPQNTNMQIQNQRRYEYYKNHFFSNYDFSDPRLLRSQILENKLNLFFYKVLKYNPDTVISEIKKLTAKADRNTATFKFVIDWLFNNYKDYNKKTGYDKILVFLVDNFIKTNKINWIDNKIKQIYLQNAEMLRPLLIGKIAPELKLKNKNDSIISLTKKYADVTILLFWSLDNEKSNKALVDIASVLTKYPDKDIQVYSVCVNSDINKWKKIPLNTSKNWINVCDNLNIVNSSGYYLQDIPRIMILDYQKKILSNNVKTKDLSKILSIIL